MKQVYTKPVLMMETFNLTQTIAAGCGAAAGGNTLGRPAQWSKSTCGWDLGNEILWAENTDANCNSYLSVDEDVNGLCYNNPGGGNSIFGS